MEKNTNNRSFFIGNPDCDYKKLYNTKFPIYSTANMLNVNILFVKLMLMSQV